jgi:hypothetical protein
MTLLQNNWERLSRELVEHFSSSTESLQRIARNAGVNYFAVRRIKNGFSRKTRNVDRLCNYFRINANEEALQPGRFVGIVRELKATWDGSEAHAQLLVELIHTTRKFKVSRTGSDTIGRVPRKSGGRARK